MDQPKDLTELLERLNSGFVYKKAGEAFPLLIRVIAECLSQQSGSPKVNNKKIAEEYGLTAATLCHWNKKLNKSGLYVSRREKGALIITPAPFINPSSVFRNYIVDEVRDRSSAMFGDLFARVRALELKF